MDDTDFSPAHFLSTKSPLEDEIVELWFSSHSTFQSILIARVFALGLLPEKLGGL